MVRLSFDLEMWRRGISAAPLSADLSAEIEADLRMQLLELVANGRAVVLDFSFRSRQMRDEYRELLRPVGAVPETIYLATDRDVVLSRIKTRRGNHPDDVILGDELAAEYFDDFEPPSPDEGPLRIISSTQP